MSRWLPKNNFSQIGLYVAPPKFDTFVIVRDDKKIGDKLIYSGSNKG